MSDDWQETAFDLEFIDWDPAKDHANQIKHQVTFKEASAFLSYRYFTEFQDWHNEPRYGVLGFSGRDILYIVCAETTDTLRIISARKATSSEKRRYGALVYQGP
jgi:uncharacterized protein